MGLVAPGHVRSSRNRYRTCVFCVGRQILHHWTNREAQNVTTFIHYPAPSDVCVISSRVYSCCLREIWSRKSFLVIPKTEALILLFCIFGLECYGASFYMLISIHITYFKELHIHVLWPFFILFLFFCFLLFFWFLRAPMSRICLCLFYLSQLFPLDCHFP